MKYPIKEETWMGLAKEQGIDDDKLLMEIACLTVGRINNAYYAGLEEGEKQMLDMIGGGQLLMALGRINLQRQLSTGSR